jgi:hypothetical protein
MANIKYRNANSELVYEKATGTGTDADPFVPIAAGVGGTNFKKTLTVTNDVYTIGDVVGGLITITSATTGAGKHAKVTSIKLAGVSALAYNLWFFAADLATPTQADNGVLTIAAADLPNYLGFAPIVAGDYVAGGAGAFNLGTVRNVGLQFASVATTIYAYMEAVATTTPGTTTLYLTIDIEYID